MIAGVRVRELLQEGGRGQGYRHPERVRVRPPHPQRGVGQTFHRPMNPTLLFNNKIFTVSCYFLGRVVSSGSGPCDFYLDPGFSLIFY